MEYLTQFFSSDRTSLGMAQNLCILITSAVVAYLLFHLLLKHVVQRILSSYTSFGAATLANSKVLKHFSKIIPCVIIQIGITMLPNQSQLGPSFVKIVVNIATALTLLYGTLTIGSFLDGVIQYFTLKGNRRLQSIKSYIQLAKIALYVAGGICVLASLIDRSPVILLSGLGAMSAVTMLVFKDTILSFVAGIQISSNDMLRLGDWIEMPQVGADGDVVDIALHTVKIQNFDKTIVTVPTWRLKFLIFNF